ncbi:MAG: DUF4465 domain-containing protein [Bacteroidia bacterium]|nr:DUF4465 domain-containing protein [Bacteroidia bacterium]
MNIRTILLSLTVAANFARAQTVADFESFTLAPNSAYSPTESTSFQTAGAVFNYEWDNSFGGFWAGGSAYTNKQDSSTGTFANLYGVKALKGYTNSVNYVVAQQGAIVKLKSPYDKVEGFYITNTTYAYKVIKNGNAFSRKFGDTTGTKSGTTIPQGAYPDYFKVTAKGYKNGSMKPDSAVFYLADYRFANNTQDYVINTWEWFNTAALGSIDSVQFFMYSSDVGSFGMNTPAFFALDNFSTSAPNPVGMKETKFNAYLSVYPNPFGDRIKLKTVLDGESLEAVLKNVNGLEVARVLISESNAELNTENLPAGLYFLELSKGTEKKVLKLIKN